MIAKWKFPISSMFKVSRFPITFMNWLYFKYSVLKFLCMKQIYERQSQPSETRKITNHGYLAIKCWSVFSAIDNQLTDFQSFLFYSSLCFCLSCAEYLPHFHRSGTFWKSLRTWTRGLHVRITDQDRYRIFPCTHFSCEGMKASLPQNFSRNGICTASPLSKLRLTIKAVCYLLSIFNSVPNICRPFLSVIP